MVAVRLNLGDVSETPSVCLRRWCNIAERPKTDPAGFSCDCYFLTDGCAEPPMEKVIPEGGMLDFEKFWLLDFSPLLIFSFEFRFAF